MSEERNVRQDEESTPRQGGGVSIGAMTGGAVASGSGASAEDRSQRVGGSEALPDVSGLTVPAPAAGGVSVGVMTGGALASGENARAVDASVRMDAPAQRLLASLGELRGQLPLFAQVEGNGVAEVEQEVVAVQGALEAGGTAPRPRLERLRDLLRSSATAVSGLASALAVVQAIEQFLG
ncbi:hypothetical protein [Kitasatospora sp. SUK 42]|uniref:hypothetical protein n=1 Tax=Kitasatospora sp. SUK 42 TaxID=1588882 RepID=UPI0018CB2E4F|nr:hypothetical protein [Kitasatospora sp. SUK 42]MBV2151892.1 hypothetical protein [Kitasatospora sp. SUK 42]